MTKRILSFALATLLLAFSFSACGKKDKPMVTGKNGKQYEAVTDENGNPKFTPNGDLFVYITNEKGKYVYNDKGEKVTDVAKDATKFTNGLTLTTMEYTFTLPVDEKEWILKRHGRYEKLGVEAPVYFQIHHLGAVPGGKDLKSMVEEQTKDDEEMMTQIRTQYPVVEKKQTGEEITVDKYFAQVLEYKVQDKEGTTIHYAQNIYFIYNGEFYCVEYVSEGGDYDKAPLNALDIVNAHLKLA